MLLAYSGMATSGLQGSNIAETEDERKARRALRETR